MTDDHCKDCCCARSWKALGIEGYTGKSIPEEIIALKTKLAVAREALEFYAELNNYHNDESPFTWHGREQIPLMDRGGTAREALAKIGEVK